MEVDNKKNSEYLVKLENDIRKEAWDLKDCCTRYSFQGIAIIAAAYALIARSLTTNSLITIAALIFSILCMLLIAIVIYKYGSSNRGYGYLLHLQRSATFPTNDATADLFTGDWHNDLGWKQWMRYAGWEEAMRAWRIFQPTIFHEIYSDPQAMYKRNKDTVLKSLETKLENRYPKFTVVCFGFLAKHRLFTTHECLLKCVYVLIQFNRLLKRETSPAPALRPKHSALGSYRWYLPKVLIATTTIYNSGNYLARLFYILSILLLVGYLMPILALIDFQSDLGLIPRLLLFVAWLIIGGVIGILFARSVKKIERLEDEIESIHSCSIIWQATIVAHYRALKYSEMIFGSLYYRYSFMLSIQAEHLTKHAGINNKHNWVLRQDYREIYKILDDKLDDIASTEDREKIAAAITP